MSYLNLAAIRTCTESEGPGKRFALWVQGCAMHCHGCCNKKMQPFVKNKIVSVSDLFSLILKSRETNKIEGVTFAGGEPILQSSGLSELAELCRAEKITVFMFTGFLYEDLANSDSPEIKKLLGNTDMLVDGPFIESEIDTERDWIGSKNQRLFFLTDAYRHGIEKQTGEHKLEIRISANSIGTNGWPFGIEEILTRGKL